MPAASGARLFLGISCLGFFPLGKKNSAVLLISRLQLKKNTVFFYVNLAFSVIFLLSRGEELRLHGGAVQTPGFDA